MISQVKAWLFLFEFLINKNEVVCLKPNPSPIFVYKKTICKQSK